MSLARIEQCIVTEPLTYDQVLKLARHALQSDGDDHVVTIGVMPTRQVPANEGWRESFRPDPDALDESEHSIHGMTQDFRSVRVTAPDSPEDNPIAFIVTNNDTGR